MMVINKQYTNQLSSHGRNGSDVTGSRRQGDENLTREQKLQMAENAIADQYASSMMNSTYPNRIVHTPANNEDDNNNLQI
jgi:hypothetical protein